MTNASLTDGQSRAATWLAAWDAQGIHRTATPGDDAGAAWLAAEARALGAQVATEEFALQRLDPVTAFVEIGGVRIPAIPAFDAPATDAAGVAGRLGPVGGDGEIAVAELSPQAVYSGEYERLRRTGRHRGFVVVCAGERPGMALLNAEGFRAPYGAPTVHVSSEAREAVLAAAAEGAAARLVADSRRTPAVARNIVVALAGAARAARPLVVVTPRTSWWQSTAERGGGIVCWLESLRALVTAPPARPVIFVATAGHELGHLGFDEFLARRPGWDRPVQQGGATWLLYGANIGAAGGTLDLASPDDELRDIAGAALAKTGQPYRATRARPNGEIRDIHRAGGHCLTVVGTNPLFHQPQDRWPESVDLGAVTRIAAAASAIVPALARG